MVLRIRQRGISLILAVFMVLIVGILAAALANIMSASTISVPREVLSARAFLAAESGAQRLLSDIAAAPQASRPSVCTSGLNTVMPALLDCAAPEVTCESLPEGGSRYYRILSIGRCGPTGDQAQRQIEVQARDL